ncbi:hypothetical protein [Microbulbifer sp. ARAS458-1]|uniref:hypothetical protein n=1 Tax=Microbulbifer sp. ARAS458-1 TaxID=3140242 RepID=UPI003877DB9F
MTVSELTYTPATELVTGLEPGQVAFVIDNGAYAGQLIRIQITRADVDTDADGVVDQVNLKVSGAVIDDQNQVQATGGGEPMVTPGKVDSIATSALAEGTESVAAVKARITDECVHRMVRLAAAMQAWESIPSAG